MKTAGTFVFLALACLCCVSGDASQDIQLSRPTPLDAPLGTCRRFSPAAAPRHATGRRSSPAAAPCHAANGRSSPAAAPRHAANGRSLPATAPRHAANGRSSPAATPRHAADGCSSPAAAPRHTASRRSSPAATLLAAEECKELWQLFRSGLFLCHRDNNPVRGPDGTTYSNKCIMCRKLMVNQRDALLGDRGNTNRNLTQKAVDCSEFLPQLNAKGELICTKENEPVCDASGHSHLNKCVMCADKFKQEAQRGVLLGSNNSQPPVSGAGGMTARQVDCRQIPHGIKGGAILCQNSWQPVCGSDGKTYSSRCSLCSEMQRTGARIALTSEGECADAAPVKADCSQYPQTKGKMLCTPSSPMVCGTDGVTHSSECTLCDKILKTRSEIGIRNIGVCAQP